MSSDPEPHPGVAPGKAETPRAGGFTRRPPPDLATLRAQLGDAVVEARLAEARGREEVARRLDEAMASGATFEEAARSSGARATSPTLRRWLERWRSFGVVGLVESRRGPVPSTGPAMPAPAPGPGQLVLAVAGPSMHPRPTPRTRGSQGRAPALLKWSGSKQGLVGQLTSLAPSRFAVYHEPFVGGGALFFALRPRRAFLGDLNAELVNLYRVVRDEPAALVAALRVHRHTREHFHAIRGIHPDALPPVERAARTLFLNRTCFNGLYRVNRHGLFNVPYGRQAHTSFFHPGAIRDAHRALRGVEVLCEDFGACAGRARAGDFVYLDPPYPVGMNEGDPVKYQAGGFAEGDQRRAAALFRILDRQGCLVMASNADTPLTRRLFTGFEILALEVTRRIGGSRQRRGRAAEIVVRNYAGRRDALPGL